MHVTGLLHSLFEKTLSGQEHKTRLRSVFHAVKAALKGQTLTLTELGRHLEGDNERSNIRTMDSFVGNGCIKHILYYKSLATILFGNTKFVDVIVDWTPYSFGYFEILRATAVLDGRAVIIYQEAHLKSRVGNEVVQDQFFDHLKKVVGDEVILHIIVDRGFKCGVFKKILSLGYQFTGRASSSMHYFSEDEGTWRSVSEDYKIKENTLINRGQVQLTKRNELTCNMIIHKGVSKKTKVKNKDGSEKRSSKNKKYKHRKAQPWVIVTSLPVRGDKAAERVVKEYSYRMQIEETNRDEKSIRFGLGFTLSRTKCLGRLSNLLLVGAIAHLAAVLVGVLAERKGWQYHFQANSTKHKRVLSLCFVGLKVIRKSETYRKYRLLKTDLLQALKDITERIRLNGAFFQESCSYA